MAQTSLTDPQIAAIATREGIDPSLVRTINDAAVAQDVPPTVLLAVAKRETDFGRGSDYDRATHRGDGGHGYGMFQLDDRTPGRESLLRQVQNDPGRAANVAAEMLHATLLRGHSIVDALHIYNSGSLSHPSTRGVFEHHMQSYEHAVVGWAHEFAEAAGLARSERREAPAVTPGDQTLVNERIGEAAQKMLHMSTRDAQTHHPELENGNVGCAYSVNKVLETALGRTYGENPLSVMSVLADIRRPGHGHEVSAGDVRPGDIAIKFPSHGEHSGHIGIVTRGGEHPEILNNSSSRGHLSNVDSPAAFSRNYVTKRDEDVVKYFRIDPASVDLQYVRTHAIPEHVLGPENAPPDPRHWTEHLPGRGVPATRRPIDDRSARSDAVIHGELHNGVLLETPEELKRKNAIVQEAIHDAKAGKTLDFRFVGNGRESAREVALQNEKLEHAIETNLPADAKMHPVKLEGHGVVEQIDSTIAKVGKTLEVDLKKWTPEMDLGQFAKLMGRMRGGAAHEAPEKSPAVTPERGPEIGR